MSVSYEDIEQIHELAYAIESLTSANEGSLRDAARRTVDIGRYIKNNKFVVYHGGAKNVDKNYLTAFAMDLGNAFIDPGWSLFVGLDKTFITKWAAFKALKGIVHDNRAANPDLNKCDIEWDLELHTFMITKKSINLLKDYLERGEGVGYVYTLEVPLSMLNIGNDSSHDELAIRTEVRNAPIPYKKKETIVVDENMIWKYGNVISKKKDFTDRIVHFKTNPNLFNAGLISLLLINDYSYNAAFNSKVIDELRKPEAREYDDLNEYMRIKGIHLEKVKPKDRLLVTLGLK